MLYKCTTYMSSITLIEVWWWGIWGWGRIGRRRSEARCGALRRVTQHSSCLRRCSHIETVWPCWATHQGSTAVGCVEFRRTATAGNTSSVSTEEGSFVVAGWGESMSVAKDQSVGNSLTLVSSWSLSLLVWRRVKERWREKPRELMLYMLVMRAALKTKEECTPSSPEHPVQALHLPLMLSKIERIHLAFPWPLWPGCSPCSRVDDEAEVGIEIDRRRGGLGLVRGSASATSSRRLCDNWSDDKDTPSRVSSGSSTLTLCRDRCRSSELVGYWFFGEFLDENEVKWRRELNKRKNLDDRKATASESNDKPPELERVSTASGCSLLIFIEVSVCVSLLCFFFFFFFPKSPRGNRWQPLRVTSGPQELVTNTQTNQQSTLFVEGKQETKEKKKRKVDTANSERKEASEMKKKNEEGGSESYIKRLVKKRLWEEEGDAKRYNFWRVSNQTRRRIIFFQVVNRVNEGKRSSCQRSKYCWWREDKSSTNEWKLCHSQGNNYLGFCSVILFRSLYEAFAIRHPQTAKGEPFLVFFG